MHDVTTPFRGDAAQQRHTEQCQIADDVQDLVSHKLIPEAQLLFVHHSFRREHDGVIERATADQIRPLQLFNLRGKAERAGRGNLAIERSIIEF